jgi:CRP/FNR family transcriptional regulator, dissimilatory nitrate respiration regulator
LSLISQRLLHTLRDIEICAQPSSLQRVAHYLLHLQPDSTQADDDIRLPALKRDIAAKLGLSQETFSRMLAFLGQQGFIRFTGNLVSVEDWERLRVVASAGCPMEAVKN